MLFFSISSSPEFLGGRIAKDTPLPSQRLWSGGVSATNNKARTYLENVVLYLILMLPSSYVGEICQWQSFALVLSFVVSE
jgi:hypothetical protein